MEKKTQDKTYVSPTIEDFGTIAELTATGATNQGSDLKAGSVSSQGV